MGNNAIFTDSLLTPTSPQLSWSRPNDPGPTLLLCQADSSVFNIPPVGACSCGSDRKRKSRQTFKIGNQVPQTQNPVTHKEIKTLFPSGFNGDWKKYNNNKTLYTRHALTQFEDWSWPSRTHTQTFTTETWQARTLIGARTLVNSFIYTHLCCSFVYSKQVLASNKSWWLYLSYVSTEFDTVADSAYRAAVLCISLVLQHLLQSMGSYLSLPSLTVDLPYFPWRDHVTDLTNHVRSRVQNRL